MLSDNFPEFLLQERKREFVPRAGRFGGETDSEPEVLPVAEEIEDKPLRVARFTAEGGECERVTVLCGQFAGNGEHVGSGRDFELISGHGRGGWCMRPRVARLREEERFSVDSCPNSVVRFQQVAGV